MLECELAWSCAGKHRCCEFTCTVALVLSCPQALLCSSSFWPLALEIFPSLFVRWSQSLQGGGWYSCSICGWTLHWLWPVVWVPVSTAALSPSSSSSSLIINKYYYYFTLHFSLSPSFPFMYDFSGHCKAFSPSESGMNPFFLVPICFTHMLSDIMK